MDQLWSCISYSLFLELEKSTSDFGCWLLALLRAEVLNGDALLSSWSASEEFPPLEVIDSRWRTTLGLLCRQDRKVERAAGLCGRWTPRWSGTTLVSARGRSSLLSATAPSSLVSSDLWSRLSCVSLRAASSKFLLISFFSSPTMSNTSSSCSESLMSGCLRLIPPGVFEARLSIDSSLLFDLCSTAASSGSASAVPLLLEDRTGTSLLDIVPKTGAIKGDLSCMSCDGSVAYCGPSSGWLEGSLPEGGRDREVKMESPMLGGRDAVNSKQKKKDQKPTTEGLTGKTVGINSGSHSTWCLQVTQTRLMLKQDLQELGLGGRTCTLLQHRWSVTQPRHSLRKGD